MTLLLGLVILLFILGWGIIALMFMFPKKDWEDEIDG
jgi:hypothetical protein